MYRLLKKRTEDTWRHGLTTSILLVAVSLGCGARDSGSDGTTNETLASSAGPEEGCREFERYISKYFPDDTSNPAAADESTVVVAPAKPIGKKDSAIRYPVSCGEAPSTTGFEAPPCDADYFPPRTLGFYVKAKEICPDAPPEWWGVESAGARQLEAWEEPSLVPASETAVETYRFVHIPSREASTVIRVEQNPKGRYLIAKYCACNETREREDVTELREMSSVQWRRFETLLEKTGFWDAPVQVNRVRREGTTWILEGRGPERYHLITRSSPDMGYFRKTGEYLMSLAGLGDRDAYCCLSNTLR